MENYTTRRTEISRPLTRRVVSNYQSRSKTHDTSMTFKERFIMQCIVCGIILAAILAVKVINTDLTKRFSSTLSYAISDNVSFESIKNGVSGALSGMFESTPQIKDDTAIENMIETEQNQTETINMPAENISIPETGGEIPQAVDTSTNSQFDINDNDFRIDEDILQQINQQQSAGTPKN